MIRSKVQCREEGERCTKFFVQLEKSNAKSKTIEALRDSNGKLITDQAEILEEQVRFYKALYSSEPQDPIAQETLLDPVEKCLNQQERESCEGDITFEEAETAIKGFKTDKSPGSDGLTSEFYKCFWNVVGHDFIAIANHAFTIGELSITQRRGIICLIFKKGDKLSLKNWRPISLLNVDYKIITKVLANRLKQVLPSIIHKDQTCGIPGRSIAETTSFVRDLIEYVNRKNLPCALICLDQMKAFDRVDWNFMFKTLKKFGFGDSFIKWVQICYTNISSAVKNNGWISYFFDLERGTRQGCPLSAILYVIIAEVLAVSVRKEVQIRGIKLPDGSEHKIAQYADDTTVAVSDTDSIEALFSLLKVYESASGAKINLDKTEGLWLGSFKYRTDQPMGLNWTSGSVKILGFHFGNGNLMDKNWKPVITKFKAVLNLWMSRDLSLQGRTVVLNYLASSGIWYYSNILSMPKWVFTELNRTMINFLWKNKKHHVRQDILRQSLEEGGLNLVDIKLKIKAQRAMWISKIWQNSFDKWAILADYFIGQYKNTNLGKDILVCKIHWYRNIQHTCQIYREFVDAWNCLQVIPDPGKMNTLSVLDQNLFLNPNITFGDQNSIFFYVEYINSGLQHIYDIVVDQKLKSFEDLLPTLGLKNTKRNRNKYEKLCQTIPKEWMGLI
jgi:hypothetical protein